MVVVVVVAVVTVEVADYAAGPPEAVTHYVVLYDVLLPDGLLILPPSCCHPTLADSRAPTTERH